LLVNLSTAFCRILVFFETFPFLASFAFDFSNASESFEIFLSKPFFLSLFDFELATLELIALELEDELLEDHGATVETLIVVLAPAFLTRSHMLQSSSDPEL